MVYEHFIDAVHKPQTFQGYQWQPGWTHTFILFIVSSLTYVTEWRQNSLSLNQLKTYSVVPGWGPVSFLPVSWNQTWPSENTNRTTNWSSIFYISNNCKLMQYYTGYTISGKERANLLFLLKSLLINYNKTSSNNSI